jgi:hypothetical protein
VRLSGGLTGKKLELKAERISEWSEIVNPSIVSSLGKVIGGEELMSDFNSPKISPLRLRLQKDFELSFFSVLSAL